MIMMGAVDLRTFKDGRSESQRGLLARLVAESRSFESAGRDAERNCWLVVSPPAWRAPSEYDIREIPEISTLEVPRPNTASSVSWLAPAANKKSPPKAGRDFEDPISSGSKQIRSALWPPFLRHRPRHWQMSGFR